MEDQYLLGPDLLVAPIVEKGATSRSVIFPKGEWFDWWTGDLIMSREEIVRAPLGVVPLYVRAGAVIPQWPAVPPSTMGYHPETLDLDVWVPSEDGVFTSSLVEDDGETFGYERGGAVGDDVYPDQEGLYDSFGGPNGGPSLSGIREESVLDQG